MAVVMPSAETLSASDAALSDLRFGKRLRQARKAKGLRLKQLADVVGCSESLLSKIENDRARPSLQMLHNIVSNLGITIGGLFSERSGSDGIVARAGERPIIRMDSSEAEGVRLECVVPDDGGHFLYGSIHIVDPGCGSAGAISHHGEEVGYVLDGVFELTVDGRSYHLNPGDSFFFNSNLAHSYRNPGSVQTKVLWVNSPPTF
jgi:transcriptional regulator with XRE-family HTH domain